MTEYDFSPGAYARYLATQRRITNWVDHTEGHRPAFGNAFTMPPSPQESSVMPSTITLRTHLHPPSSQMLRTSRSQNFCPQSPPRFQTSLAPSYAGTHRSGLKHDLQPAVPSLRTSQSQNFYSQSLHSQSRPSAALRDQASAHAPTYVASRGPAKPSYIYAPAGSVPSGGLVTLPSNEKRHNASVIPPTTEPSQAPQQYRRCVYPAAQAYQVSVSSHHTTVSPPPPSFTQKIYAPSGYAYQQNFHAGRGTPTPLISPPSQPAHAPAPNSTVFVMQPIILPVVEKSRRSRSAGHRRGKKNRDKEKEKGREGKRSRSEVRGRQREM